jgi:hypothetical protein
MDIERYWSFLAPIVAVGVAVVFDRIWKKHGAKALFLLTVPLAGFASAETYRTGTRDLRLLALCSGPAIISIAYAFRVCLANAQPNSRVIPKY